MSSVFRAATPDDEPRITDLLMRAFSVGRDAHFLNPELWHWKYGAPREDCPEPRSCVIERDGRIVAHAGLWPVNVLTAGGTRRGVHMIDWASDAQVPGAGASLLQRLAKTYDFVIAIGGSEATRTILPRFGFRELTTAQTFARPLRPWRQMLKHQSRDVKLPVRFLRNVLWAKFPAGAPASGWTVAEARLDDAGSVFEGRDAGFFRYLQQCPAVRFLCFDIWHGGRKVGFFALAVVGEQARLAGVTLAEAARADWRTALELAQHAALRHTTAAELVYRTARPEAAGAAMEAGLRLRGAAPVFLFRRGAEEVLPIDFQLYDNDEVFLTAGRPEFLT